MPAFTGLESGPVTEVEEHENAFNVYFQVDPDFELGFTLFKEDLYKGVETKFRPVKGAHVEVDMSDHGPTYVAIDNRVVFHRTPIEAAIWKEIRKHEVEIAKLREQLNGSHS